VRLDAADCRSRFVAAQCAILAVNDALGPPLVVPITFAVVVRDGVDVVLTAVDHKPKSTVALRRLRLLRADPRVAVLVDRYESDWDRLWWVRADGHATVSTTADRDGERRAADLAALGLKYAQYREHAPSGDLVRIRVDRWSGWCGERQA
jgi:PPOX class probable F420-dependent enzyme